MRNMNILNSDVSQNITTPRSILYKDRKQINEL